MNKMKKDGVKYEQWRPQHLKRFKKIWEEIAEEEAEKDLLFAEVYKSHKDFRKKYAQVSGMVQMETVNKKIMLSNDFILISFTKNGFILNNLFLPKSHIDL